MKPISPTRLLLAMIFFAGLLLGAALIIVLLVVPCQSTLLAQASPTAVPTPTLQADADYAVLDARDQVLINLYQRISPSVVHVTSRSDTIDIFGVQPSEGTGS